MAVGTAPILASRLTAVLATDTTTFLVVPSVVLAVALIAAWAPMWRAMRISPAEVLKSE